MRSETLNSHQGDAHVHRTVPFSLPNHSSYYLSLQQIMFGVCFDIYIFLNSASAATQTASSRLGLNTLVITQRLVIMFAKQQ